ncbi:hypothetical protein K5D34_04830 [Pseudomonas cichorii]|uniref:Uncharacterized protein n=1 Tax=Pseudomonas lijiangensis TaxID=2995658 RepID=A0ABX8HYR7_9PSED|nr:MULTISPECIES: hypothetical protein [Pseudomonas syringae group]MBX8490872.1 hypothetical protein [Pseudomonas cichorii]MBX8499191.1 hypothetical protein [Pseudomonas lijiangensis]MBX8504770.1 hypothetical protein [Pseudomonas lijiangensis]MBX8509013.1 hypothetical protein [Pseudomonas cichorii]MBX8518319.1 hypothetical protein [Pseudomonas cichorii]
MDDIFDLKEVFGSHPTYQFGAGEDRPGEQHWFSLFTNLPNDAEQRVKSRHWILANLGAYFRGCI